MPGRIRSIKPEVLEDEVAASLSDAAWRLWVSMWTLADDYGNVRAGAKYLAASVWQDTARDVESALQELIDKGRIHPYAVEGQRYVTIHAWDKHQRVDNAGKPRVPPPSEDDGTWNQGLTSKVAECRRHNRRSSETLGDSPLAQSGGETTDHRPPTTDHRSSLAEASSGVHAISDSVGKRITPDWKPKDETVKWAAQQGVDAMACRDEFVEYWLTIAGAKGRRSNWDLVLRGRIRKLIQLGQAPRIVRAPPESRPVVPGLRGTEADIATVRDLFGGLAASKRPPPATGGTGG